MKLPYQYITSCIFTEFFITEKRTISFLRQPPILEKVIRSTLRIGRAEIDGQDFIICSPIYT